MNQDSLGVQADLMIHQDTKQIWGGQLSNNRFVYICFNRDTASTTFEIDFDQLIPSHTVTKIREVIDRVDVQVPSNRKLKTKTVRGHAVAMYVVTYE